MAQPPSLVLGSKTAGGGLGRSFPWGLFPGGKEIVGPFFFSPVLMLHKLEDVAFFETRWFGFRYFPR